MTSVPGWPEDAVEVGRILDAWGIKGWIKVQPFSAQPDALLAAGQWHLMAAEGVLPARPASAPGRPSPLPLPSVLQIKSARRHGDVVVATAHEVPDRNAAEALKGARVFVSRASFPAPAEGEFYWVDLLGLQVVNRQGEVLGTVADLVDTGPHTVLRIVADANADAHADAAVAEPVERLVPFVEAYVDAVDLAARRITVDWGLDF
jgi:16S rRNA processing protein RimM